MIVGQWMWKMPGIKASIVVVVAIENMGIQKKRKKKKKVRKTTACKLQQLKERKM